MRIPLSEITPGDILVFKGSGPVYNILSRILKLFERRWDRWGWHTAVVISYHPDTDDWMIIEALGKGVCINPLDNYLPSNTRAYRWLEHEPPPELVSRFVEEHTGRKYDVLLYFWTAAAYLFRHFWNRRIPRLLDGAFTCWELTAEACEYFGKPIISKYDCPVLTDILKKIE